MAVQEISFLQTEPFCFARGEPAVRRSTKASLTGAGEQGVEPPEV